MQQVIPSMLSPFTVAPLLIQLPHDEPGKTVDNDPTGYYMLTREISVEFLVPDWLNPVQDIVSQTMKNLFKTKFFLFKRNMDKMASI